jgi:hypothetical protein
MDAMFNRRQVLKTEFFVMVDGNMKMNRFTVIIAFVGLVSCDNQSASKDSGETSKIPAKETKRQRVIVNNRKISIDDISYYLDSGRLPAGVDFLKDSEIMRYLPDIDHVKILGFLKSKGLGILEDENALLLHLLFFEYYIERDPEFAIDMILGLDRGLCESRLMSCFILKGLENGDAKLLDRLGVEVLDFEYWAVQVDPVYMMDKMMAENGSYIGVFEKLKSLPDNGGVLASVLFSYFGKEENWSDVPVSEREYVINLMESVYAVERDDILSRMRVEWGDMK